MFISVIIPVKQICNYLVNEGFPAFQKQINKNFEVIVVMDNYVGNGLDHSLPYKNKWLKILKHSGSPSEKRNYGVKCAKGKILAFIDDDAYPKINWLSNVGAAFRRPKGAETAPLQNTIAMCGPGILPSTASFSEKVFDSVLTSKLGSGTFTFRFQKENARFVDDYPLMNFALLKSVYRKFGGLTNHWPGEDSKLCEKIINAGFKIKYSPNLVVYHHRKNTLIEFLRQHSRYGFKRGQFFIEGDQNSRKVIYLLPSLFLIYLSIMPLLFLLNYNYFLFLPVLAYILFLIIFLVLEIYKKRDISLSIVSSLVLIFLHVVYAIFFIKGLYRWVGKPGYIDID